MSDGDPASTAITETSVADTNVKVEEEAIVEAESSLESSSLTAAPEEELKHAELAKPIDEAVPEEPLNKPITDETVVSDDIILPVNAEMIIDSLPAIVEVSKVKEMNETKETASEMSLMGDTPLNAEAVLEVDAVLDAVPLKAEIVEEGDEVMGAPVRAETSATLTAPEAPAAPAATSPLRKRNHKPSTETATTGKSELKESDKGHSSSPPRTLAKTCSLTEIASPTFLSTLTINKLNLPAPVIFVIGGMLDMSAGRKTRLKDLFTSGVAKAADHAGAFVVDSGMADGIVATYRSSAASYEAIGVSISNSEEPVSLSKKHTEILIVSDAEAWGAEAVAKSDLISNITKRKDGGSCLVCCIAAGDSIAAESDAVEAVQRGWPIIVLQGTGGYADRIALAYESKSATEEPLNEIVTRGRITVFPSSLGATDLAALIHIRLITSVY